MSVTLVINDETGQGHFTGVAANGKLAGAIAISGYEQGVSRGKPVLRFTGIATVDHGTGYYTHSRADDLRVIGRLVPSEGSLDFRIAGKLVG
jgi:hypothetical protein